MCKVLQWNIKWQKSGLRTTTGFIVFRNDLIWVSRLFFLFVLTPIVCSFKKGSNVGQAAPRTAECAHREWPDARVISTSYKSPLTYRFCKDKNAARTCTCNVHRHAIVSSTVEAKIKVNVPRRRIFQRVNLAATILQCRENCYSKF